MLGSKKSSKFLYKSGRSDKYDEEEKPGNMIDGIKNRGNKCKINRKREMNVPKISFQAQKIFSVYKGSDITRLHALSVIRMAESTPGSFFRRMRGRSIPDTACPVDGGLSCRTWDRYTLHRGRRRCRLPAGLCQFPVLRGRIRLYSAL